MLQTLIKVIPLDIASTLSPGILALAVFFLSNKKRAEFRTFWFLIGSLIVGIGISVLGVTLGKLSQVHVDRGLILNIFDIVLGLVFLYFGIKILISKEKKIRPIEFKNHEILKLLILGFIVTITNFDALILNFSAAKEIGAAPINDFSKLILLIIGILFFILPIWLPMLIYLIFPKFATPILSRLNSFIFKYSKYIVFALFIIFGIYFILKGI